MADTITVQIGNSSTVAVAVGDGATITIPSGTGFRHVTAGVEDLVSKLVTDTDIDPNANIAPGKLTSGGNGQLLATYSGAPTWVTVAGDVTFSTTLSTSVVQISGSGGFVPLLCDVKLHGTNTYAAFGTLRSANNKEILSGNSSGVDYGLIGFNAGTLYLGSTTTKTNNTTDVFAPKLSLHGGNNSAATGTLNLPNPGTIKALGSGGSDVQVIVKDSADNILVGSTNTNQAESCVAAPTTTSIISGANVQVGQYLSGIESTVAGVPPGALRLKSATYSITSGNVVLTAAQYSAPFQIPTGDAGTQRTVTCPDAQGAIYIVYNASTTSVRFTKGGPGGATILAGQSKIIIHDGADYRIVG
jgi:hypothetical protein